MPVQSGSDRILKRMIRRYTRAEYETRIRHLLSARAGLTLSTDVIVGFPGETESDFAETLEMVKALGFVGVFGFKYSPRPFTPALKLGDDVSEADKADRLRRLFEVSEANTSAHLATLVGSTQRVLVEGESRANQTLQGRTERNEIVHVEDNATHELVGELIDVTILRANKHSLFGEPTEHALASLTAHGSDARARTKCARARRRTLTVVA